MEPDPEIEKQTVLPCREVMVISTEKETVSKAKEDPFPLHMTPAGPRVTRVRPPREKGNGKGKRYKGQGSSFEYEAGRPPGNLGEPEVLAAPASIGRAASDRTSAVWP